MGTTALINGISAYVLSTIIKIYYNKEKSKFSKKLHDAILIRFKKGDVFSAGSFLQLIGVFWLLIGITENIFAKTFELVPSPILFAGELFIPLILSMFIARISYH